MRNPKGLNSGDPMLKFAANVSLIWRERPFLERLALARSAGFDAVEFWWHSDWQLESVARELADLGLKCVLHNMNSGNMPAGERGFANDPARQSEWRDAFQVAAEFSQRVGNTRINCLAGRDLGTLSADAQLACVEENYRWALPVAEKHGVSLYIEPLNTFDTPGYLWPTTASGAAFMQRIGSPRVRLQYDTYHMGRMEGPDVTSVVRAQFASIGHIQIADIPDRHEPGTGQIDWPAFFGALEALNYDGYVGLEYIAATTTEDSLKWLPAGKRSACAAADLQLATSR